MNETLPPAPSFRSLVLSTIAAIFLAVVILVVAVLPAEYGIEPTGLGKRLGLTPLSLSAEQPANVQAIVCSDMAEQWMDSVKITVPARSGLEYKFHLLKGARLEYSWSSDGVKLYFDFHGEPKGDTSGYFKSYKEDTDIRSSGSLTAPFEGSHGWYWENKSQRPVTVLLQTRGAYRILGLM